MTNPRNSRRSEVIRWLTLRDRNELSFRELSNQSGIPSATLSSWSQRLRKEKRSSHFKEIEVVEDPSPPKPLKPKAGLRLILSGVTIEVSPDFDSVTLDRLLALIRSSC